MPTYEVVLKGTPLLAKRREPWVVGVLSLVTLYIYTVWWWYTINRELRDLGNTRQTDLGQNPGQSALAIGPGFLLIVPWVVTVYRTFHRIRISQQHAGALEPINGWVYGLLLAFITPLGFAYAQSKLNDAWDSDALTTPVDPLALTPKAQATRVGVAPEATGPSVPEVGPPPEAQNAAPDWYPDPKGEARLRYWDGKQWTANTSG